MKQRLGKPAKALSLAALALLFLTPSGAHAAFGLKPSLAANFTAADGSPSLQAGSHPFAFDSLIEVNTELDSELGFEIPAGAVKDLVVSAPPGLVGNPTAVPRCDSAGFSTIKESGGGGVCPDSTVLGVVTTTVAGPDQEFTSPIFNLEPPPGAAARIGFWTLIVPFTIDLRVKTSPPYNVIATPSNIPQVVPFYASEVSLWGNPAGKEHDEDRGECSEFSDGKSCPVSIPEEPFLTLPTSCTGPLPTRFEAFSWEGDAFAETVFTHDNSVPPTPLGITGCGKLKFSPEVSSKPTTQAAESPSGLDVTVSFEDEGLTDPEGRAQSQIKKAVVRLPRGVTLNPSVADGLATCSVAELGRETYDSEPGEGCPQASKLGEVEVETPLLEGKLLHGAVYMATQDENTLDTRFAIYIVIRDPELGISVKLAGKVAPDERTGQIITTFEDIPQFPFSEFRFHFREGLRSPLVTPPACGTYETEAEFTPWSGSAPRTIAAPMQIASGVGGGACPPNGTPPFEPGFAAGTQNNAAGSYSPFGMRITRRDGDQDLTKFSAELPPGLVARLAGTTQCSEAAIAQARSRTGKGEGVLELTSPSCPASSQIGSVLGGAGVGAVLTYAPGRVYLAGRFNGAPLSAVGVVPAVAGPFDVGTVVVRFALHINPRTAEVSVDGSASDPIPHILAGIPLKVRDIRASIDRRNFTINPTSCDPFEVGGTLWGGGADVFSTGDDSPLGRSSRFQAADCASLGFKPRLSLKLKGSTKRGGHPVLTGEYRPRSGEANLAGLVLRLPRSAFLDQAHIGTICTRVQFAAKACPPKSVYGKAIAYTPLLEQPLSGPVYLRSSNNNLPDFVADLHGLIDVEAVARIDSKRGGIRATFTDVPDAPLTKVVVRMQGGKKGLIVNSRNLCGAPNRANARFSGHNGKRATGRPLLSPTGCAKASKARDGRQGR